jgi:leucyl-tRNA synthetase
VLFDAGHVSTNEPFQKLYNQGMILANSYQDEKGKYHYPEQVKRNGDDWVVADSGATVKTQVEKMGKSKLNVVNPDDVIKMYGADSMRMYEMFMGPLDRDKPWTDEGVQGVNRFLKRAWFLFMTETGELSPKIQDTGGSEGLEKKLHQTIKAVTHDIENLQFNTGIARMMEFVNDANKQDVINRGWAEAFVLVLSPFAPHIAEELWQSLGHEDTLSYHPWPTHDESLLVEDTVEIPVQVNGKLRSRVTVPAGADQDTMLEAAKADAKVAENIDGKTIVKEIAVPGKMVNLVVK